MSHGERFQLQNLAPEYRRPAVVAALLFLCMFLPWYTRSADKLGNNGRLTRTETTLSAFSSFSWVEAAVLLVAVSVLGLVYIRGQKRPFHLPGGDGTIIAAAGVWVSALVVYRFVDNKQSLQQVGSDIVTVDYGVTWGIFVTLFVAIGLVFAGLRLRAAHLAEPPNPSAGEPGPPSRRSPLPAEDPQWDEDEHETRIAQGARAVDPLRYDDA